MGGLLLNLGLPRPFEDASENAITYVALPLPLGWDAVVTAIHAILGREGGTTAAAAHPPHVTLHPPFRLRVPRAALSEALIAAAANLQPTATRIGDVDTFLDGAGDVAQIILRVEGGFCERVHAVLLDALSFAWDGTDQTMLALWPDRHRRNGFTPHISLAIGSFAPNEVARSAQLARAREVTARLESVIAEPRVFIPDRLVAIAYVSRLDGSLPTAGPAVIASAVIGGAP